MGSITIGRTVIVQQIVMARVFGVFIKKRLKNGTKAAPMVHKSTGAVVLKSVSSLPDRRDCTTPPSVRAEARHCNKDGSQIAAVSSNAITALSPSFPASSLRRSFCTYPNIKTVPHIIMPRNSI